MTSASFTSAPVPTRALPTPVAVRMSAVDGMVQVFVPAGPFLFGSTDSDLHANPDEKPQRSVAVADLWVDQTEVTNAQYARCVRAGACTAPANTTSASRNAYYGNATFDNYPVIYVGWDKAQAYCVWAGRRLPLEIEWEKAARGTEGALYPWGNAAPDRTFLNYNGLIGDTTAVGSYPAGASPYGAFDMAGNVSEWTRTIANRPGPIRGGSAFDGAANVRAAVRTTASETAFVGFRCVQ